MRRIAIGLVLAGALVALTQIACEDPAAPITGVTAVSSMSQGHVHRGSIPLSDIENPPMGGRTYTSTTDAGHSHTVRLSEVQLADLQQSGTSVAVTSSSSDVPAPHTHVFQFVR
jgi:hypothetical protein